MLLMNNNIFFNKDKKFNPDISNKLKIKENERKTSYQLKDIIDKPILNKKIIVDESVDLKKRIIEKQNERNNFDAMLISKTSNNNSKSLPFINYNPVENISKPKPIVKNNKSDKILKDLKKLGILK